MRPHKGRVNNRSGGARDLAVCGPGAFPVSPKSAVRSIIGAVFFEIAGQLSLPQRAISCPPIGPKVFN